ncbi:MAG: polyamine aminopropyltransferase [Pseudomonadota bacterium]
MDWFDETLHRDWVQRLAVAKVLFHAHSAHQDIIIFENSRWGKVLALDGVVQTTTADEAAYHEMLVHPAIVAHGRVEDVLIIGGGDGGSLREVLKHQGVHRVLQIEIDQGVIDLCRQYLPELSQGAFDDPRATVSIEDGARYVRESSDDFDVIIVDSTDPIGPGEILFSREFYRYCHARLREGGILITQSGNPAVAAHELSQGQQRLREAGFLDVSFLLTSVPTYVGGVMALAWASDDRTLRELSRNTIAERLIPNGLRYYNPAVHEAAFAHPNWMKQLAGHKY